MRSSVESLPCFETRALRAPQHEGFYYAAHRILIPESLAGKESNGFSALQRLRV